MNISLPKRTRTCPGRLRILFLFVLSLSFLLLPSPVQAAPASFPDVSGHWAEAEINYLLGQGIVGGLPSGNFGVNLPITRAQAAKMIAVQQALPSQTAAFSDVSAAHWANGVIGAVAAAGLMGGFPDGSFHPDQPLTRAEAAALLANTFLLSATITTPTYSDVSLAHWASGAVEGMAANFIAAGYPDGSFQPGKKVSRGEFSVFLARALNPVFKVKVQLLSLSATIVQNLQSQNLTAIQPYVHPTLGLRFSPYNYVQASDLVFPASAMPGLLASSTLYSWGFEDGSGNPINKTPYNYFQRYVINKNYTAPDEIKYNTIITRGTLINNIATFYPAANIVEYHVYGSAVYSGMDWGSLYLIYENYLGNWYLTGIVHGEWTT